MIRDAGDFYGRKRELARLYARIGAERPQSVAITGERRIGKSSLLWFLQQSENAKSYLADPERTIFVLRDFQENREMTPEEFCATLLAPLSKRIPNTQIDGSYDSMLEAVQHLDAQGFKLIILLDEFETVTQNPNFGARFYAFLRSLANRYNVAYITSSRVPLQHLCYSRQIADSPFFNIFSSMHIRGFGEAEAQELIAVPSQKAGIPLEAHADFLLDVGGSYPFFLQIACSILFEHLQTGEALDDYGREEVEMGIMEEAEPHFTYIWERMDEAGQRVCSSIAEDKPVDVRERGTLRSLIQQGYVVESEDHKEHRLFSSLFARWILESVPEPEAAHGEYAAEAIVVIDICGSTPIANRYGANRLRALYEALEKIVVEVAERFRDRYRRTTGDGVLLTFNTAEDAVNASLEIQQRVREHNASADELNHIPIRFSIHFGETLTDGAGRRYGDAVNMAFRVESLSVEELSRASGLVIPNEDYILVTEQVANILASAAAVSCQELGTFELKGFTGLHRVYQLIRNK